VSTLKIGLHENRLRYRPGEELTGRALWLLDEDPEAVEIRLFWRTEGRGDQDVALADSVRFERPGRREQKDFRFALPDSPYSFSGKYASLVWALELVVLPSQQTERVDFTLAPTGYEVFLEKDVAIEIDEGS